MKRVTLVIDDDVDKIIHQRQAVTIAKTNDSYSYSRCVNDLIRGVKK